MHTQQQLRSALPYLHMCARCFRSAASTSAIDEMCLYWNKYTLMLLHFFKCSLFKRSYPSRRVDSFVLHCPEYERTRGKQTCTHFLCLISHTKRGNSTQTALHSTPQLLGVTQSTRFCYLWTWHPSGSCRYNDMHLHFRTTEKQMSSTRCSHGSCPLFPLLQFLFFYSSVARRPHFFLLHVLEPNLGHLTGLDSTVPACSFTPYLRQLTSAVCRLPTLKCCPRGQALLQQAQLRASAGERRDSKVFGLF